MFVPEHSAVSIPRNLYDALEDAIRRDSETAAWMLGRALAEGDEKLRDAGAAVLENALHLRLLARQGLRIERRSSPCD